MEAGVGCGAGGSAAAAAVLRAEGAAGTPAHTDTAVAGRAGW